MASVVTHRHRASTPWLVGLSVAAGTGHVVYPAMLGTLAKIRSPRLAADANGTTWSAITVVVPAYREGRTIIGKVEGVRSNGYEGPLEIIVVSEDPDTAAWARRAGVVVIEPTHRVGKSQAVNAGVAAASHDYVVVTDANNQLAPGSLAALVRHFDDGRVGGVAGAKTEDGEGEALYWRFESWLKERESQLGTTLGMVGELFAVRKVAWRPIPADIGSDDLWTALDLAERGYRVQYEPSARSIEPSAPRAAQWERRARIGAMALHVFVRKAHLLRPRHALLMFEIIGHKLWRSTIGPIAHVVLLAASVATCRRNPLARAVLGAHVVGGTALVLQRRGTRLPRPLLAGCQVLYLQLVALEGMRRWVRHQHGPLWSKPQRS